MNSCLFLTDNIVDKKTDRHRQADIDNYRSVGIHGLEDTPLFSKSIIERA